MLISTVQLAYPDYASKSWHTYLGGWFQLCSRSITDAVPVFVAMMFCSYLILCLPTKQVSWFNMFATTLGTLVLIVTTIWLPVAAPELNSAKRIFTDTSYNGYGAILHPGHSILITV